MASHREHELFNLVLLVPSLYFVPGDYRVFFGIGYLLGTFLLSPDIDLSFSKPSQRMGKLKYLWFPFWIFSRHRGITHVPFLGSLVKLLYLVALFLFLYFIFLGVVSILGISAEFLYEFDPFDLLINAFQREETFYFVIGIILSDLYHIILDGITSFVKRLMS